MKHAFILPALWGWDRQQKKKLQDVILLAELKD